MLNANAFCLKTYSFFSILLHLVHISTHVNPTIYTLHALPPFVVKCMLLQILEISSNKKEETKPAI